MTTPIDLRQCVPGQKLLLRNGETAVYIEQRHYDTDNEDYPWPHKIEYAEAQPNAQPIVSGHRHDGTYSAIKGDTTDVDVIQILPVNPTSETFTMPNLSACQPGQLLRLRNGHFASYVSRESLDGFEEFPHDVEYYEDSVEDGDEGYRDDGTFDFHHGVENPLDIVHVYPLGYTREDALADERLKDNITEDEITPDPRLSNVERDVLDKVIEILNEGMDEDGLLGKNITYFCKFTREYKGLFNAISRIAALRSAHD